MTKPIMLASLFFVCLDGWFWFFSTGLPGVALAVLVLAL